MLDFTIAKMNHQMWKRKLAKAVHENVAIDEKEMVSERDCKLGQWLYSEGLDKYNKFTEMGNLEKKHAELHRLTFAILEEKKEGDINAATSSLKRLGDLSVEIVSLLDTLEGKIKLE